MKLSETIRSRRGALGLTQEQLADTLGVTAAAVSKWENDLSLPDMALLPALARRLETDPNTLLGFSAEPTRSEIAEFLNLLCDTGRQEGFDASLALARRKLQEYPARGRMLPEIMPLYEKAAASPDETVARQAKTMLVLRYRDAGRYADAQALLSELPGPVMPGKEQLQAGLYCSQGRWAEAGQVTESWLALTVSALVQALATLVEVALAEQRPADADAIAAAGRQMLALLGYPGLTGIHLELVAALKQQDAPRAVALLRQLSDAARRPEPPLQAQPFFRHLPAKPDGKGQTAELYQAMMAELIRQAGADPDMAFLQGDPAFDKWLAEAKAEFAAG